MPEGFRIAGKTKLLTATPTITASMAYATGNLIGSAALTFAAAREAPSATIGGAGVVRAIMVADKDNQHANIDLVFFSAALTSTLTDKSAFAPNAADLLNVIGLGQITSYAQFSANAFGYAGNLYIPFSLGTGITLNVIAVARGAATWTTTSALQFGIAVDPD